MTRSNRQLLLSTALTGLLAGLTACGPTDNDADPNAGIPVAAEQKATEAKASCGGKNGCPQAAPAADERDATKDGKKQKTTTPATEGSDS